MSSTLAGRIAAAAALLLAVVTGCGDGSTVKETRWGNGTLQSRVTLRPRAEGGYIQDGPYTVWYDNGQVKEEGHYVQDQFDGRIVHYWENGAKKAESVWSQGRIVEPWKHWDTQGNPLPDEPAAGASAPKH
ncbi:MAG: hypothetical protein K1X74_05730 [Pirellulales bacterium]|nr:hypothetical protein [Pirellulales bacterium]